MARDHVRVTVSFRELVLFPQAILRQVDASGGFLAEEHPMPVGTELLLSPLSDPALQVQARVLRVVESCRARGEGEAPGMFLVWSAAGEEHRSAGGPGEALLALAEEEPEPAEEIVVEAERPPAAAEAEFHPGLAPFDSPATSVSGVIEVVQRAQAQGRVGRATIMGFAPPAESVRVDPIVLTESKTIVDFDQPMVARGAAEAEEARASEVAEVRTAELEMAGVASPEEQDPDVPDKVIYEIEAEPSAAPEDEASSFLEDEEEGDASEEGEEEGGAGEASEAGDAKGEPRKKRSRSRGKRRKKRQ